MHGVQLVQITHCELIEAFIGLFFNKGAEVLLSMFTLFDFSLENFLQLVDLVERLRVAFLVTLLLFECLLFNLLFDCHIVIFEAPQG